MRTLHSALEQRLEQFLKDHPNLSEERSSAVIQKVIKSSVPQIATDLLNNLKAKAPSMIGSTANCC